jgi:hypothetical protein
MDKKRSGGMISLTSHQLEALLERAAETGARRALHKIGLHSKNAGEDIRDLRSLLDCIRFVRRTAVQTAVRLITTGILLALIAGLAIKLKFFNNGS